jgi:alpha 1,3-glucosidase
LDTKRREPWAFGEPHTGHIRDAIRRRYALMPYLYALFEKAHRSPLEKGTPVLRPLWYEFPDDDAVASADDVAMLGPALLVAPVLAKGAATRETYLPAGTWYDYDTGEAFVGPVTVTKRVTVSDAPLYVRGGFIVPRRDRARRSVAAAAGDPLTLLVAPDADGFATGEAYFDDGVGYDFVEGEGHDAPNTASFMRRRFTFDDGVLACGASKSTGSDAEQKNFRNRNFPDAATRVERVVLLGADAGTYASEAEVRVFSQTDSLSERTFAVDVERAPTSERGGEAGALAARKPDVAVADDWSVRFFLQ